MTDRTAIVELLAEFAAATDGRDWDAITSLLTDDCVAYGARGPVDVVRRMQDHLGGVGPTQHLLGNHRVAVTGDEARSLTYARVYHVGAGPMTGSFFECLGEYDDRWTREDSRWRLSRRSFDIRIALGDREVLRPA